MWKSEPLGSTLQLAFEVAALMTHTRCVPVGPPVSAFQKRIRANASVLKDHICKEMNELNLERCRCIPKGVPGADWRVLQEIVAADPAREKYKVISQEHDHAWPYAECLSARGMPVTWTTLALLGPACLSHCHSQCQAAAFTQYIKAL